MNKRFLIFIFITVLISIKTIAPSLAQDPFIPKYDAFKRSERCFTITDELDNQFGSVWWADKIDFSNDTIFNFVVYMGSKDDGADGLAFVMHKDPRDTITDVGNPVTISGNPKGDLAAATGDDGGGLGYAYKTGNFGQNTIPGIFPEPDQENHKIQPSVAIEIDTYYNKDNQDGKSGPYQGWDHTAVVYNGDIYGQQQTITDALGVTGGILPLKPDYAFGVGNNNIEDDGCYTFQIRWDVLPDGTQDLELWADTYDGTTGTGGLSLIMTYNDDMITNVFGGDATNMRFGFTGSTGGKNNEQTVCLLGENLNPLAADDYVSMDANSSEVIDVLSNDNDPDNDDLFVPVIIDFPLNGLSVIYDSVMIDGTTKSFLRYTPNANYTGNDSLSYVTCDANSTKCYAKCDTAFVYITVGCIPFDVDVTVTSPNSVCTDTLPDNGSAGATALATSIQTFWFEQFDDLADGLEEDTGSTPWSWRKETDVDGGNNDNHRVVDLGGGNKAYEISHTRGEAVWTSGIIDISTVTNADISLDLTTMLDGKEDAADYMRAYYILDGGGEIPFDNGIQDGIFGSATASVQDLVGSTVQIVVRINSENHEHYMYLDNVLVNVLTPPIPTTAGFTFDWYDGATATGPIIYTGAVNNGMSHGLYTVIATDDLTGCPSNPATITIDSAGSAITGGFIKQLSPFTNCAIPYDGALEAGVFDGSDSVTVGYSFDWYFQEDPKSAAFKKSTGSVFQNLASRDYSVVITEAASGCDTIINEEVINEVVLPTLTANKLVDVTSCSDPNTGSAGASVLASTVQSVWFEEFDDLADGLEVDAGPTAWSWRKETDVGTGNNDKHEVKDLGGGNKAYEISHTRGEAVWTGGLIDISSFTDVDISLDLTSMSDGNEDVLDYMRAYYILDGGGEIPLNNGIQNGIFGPATATATASNLNGSTLQIVVRFNCENHNHFMYLDNVLIDVLMPPAPTTAGFAFNWYDGSVTKAIPDFVGSGYNTIPAGQYTVVAIDSVTSCISDPATVTVNDLTVLPLIEVTVDSEQISCDILAPTGELSGVVNEGGPLTTSGYTFNWYKGPNDIIPARAGYSGGPTVDSLEVGAYRLVVITDITNCTSFIDTLIQDNIVMPADITLTQTHVTSCAAPNGTITITPVGNPADYTYELYNGLGVVVDSLLLSTSSTSISNLPIGNYTAIAIDNITKCATNPAMITINDITVIPTATFASVDQISCDPLNFTGQLTAAVGVGVPADYTFEWYSDNLITPIGGNSEVLALVDSGNYALRLTDNISLCSNVYYPRIDELLTYPVVTVSSVPTTFCGAAVNGEVHALADGVTAGYTFDWNSLLSGNLGVATADVTGLPADDYTVRATNSTTKCVSNVMMATIANTPIIPTATFVSVDQISCDPLNFTGQLTATVGAGVPADYTFQWYSNNLVTPIGGNSEVLALVDSGDYALRLRNNTSLCMNVYYSRIDEVITLPVVTVSSVPTTYCGAAVNGEVHALADGVTAGYTFDWNSLLSGNLGVATADVTGLPADDYTVRATNSTTKCVSNIALINIADNAITPNPAFTTTDNSSCDVANPNGDITVSDVTNKGAYAFPGDYNFAWYDGNSSGPSFPTVPVSSPQIPDLSAGTVALVITNSTTQCSNEVFSIINKIDIFPVIDLVNMTDATNCAEPYLSDAIVPSVTDPVSAIFTYQWTNLDGGPVIAGNGNNITDIDFTDEILPPGNYQVIATNEYTCPSAPVTFEIKDISVPPPFNLISFHNISCDAANPVGSLVAERPDNSYTISQYEWFITSPIPANAIGGPTFSPDTTILDLAGANYAVRVTDNATQCTSVEYATILDLPANNLLIDTVYTNPITKCTNPDGELGLKVVAMEQIPPLLSQNRTYTFNVTNLPDIFNLTSDPSGARPDTVAFVNLGAGDWIATVEDGFSHCVSAPLTINLAEAPGVVFTRLDSILPADCSGAAIGSFQFEASSASNPALVFPTPANPAADIGFKFDWIYKGTQFVGPDNANPGTVLPAKTDGFREWRDDLLAGYYIVSATDYYSDCVASDTVYIPVLDAPPSVASVGQDAQDCVPGNGRIDFQVNGDASHGMVNDYNVILYTGTTATAANLKRMEPLAGVYGDFFSFGTGGPGTDYPEPIPPGDYTLVTQEKVAPFCLSVPTVVTVVMDLTNPTLAAPTLIDDFSCKPGAGTGGLTALATDGDNGDNLFDYEWYSGPDASGVSFANTASIINQEAGVFTVKATDTDGRGNGCSYEQTFILPKVLKNITLSSSVINNSNCAPFENGSAQITNIAEDGGDVGVLPAGYTDFTILDSGFGVEATNLTAAAFNALSPGDYYLRAQNSLTDCYTEIQSITINDLSVDPAITIVANSQDFGCTGLTANGDLEANIGGLTAGYDFNWYKGIIAAPNLEINAANATGLSANSSSQLYTVQVEDTDGTDGSLGCIASKEYTLIHQPTSIILLSTDVTSTDQTICGPNGSIFIDQMIKDDGSGPIVIIPDYSLSGFDAQLLDQTMTPIAQPYATFTPLTGEFGANDVPAGTYYVQASMISTGCGFSRITQVMIDDLSVDPIVNVLMDNPDYACAGGTPTGILNPTILGGSDGDGILGNFTVSWTSLTGVNPVTVDATARAIDLIAGDYQIVVTDNSLVDLGCVTTIDYTLAQDRQDIDITGLSTDQTICSPNGTVQITSMLASIGGVPQADPGWTVSLLDANSVAVPPGATITGVAGVDDTFAGLGDATYFLQAQNNFTKCYSDPLQLIINDLSTNPNVVLVQESPDYACAGGIPTGILNPTILGGSDGDGALGNFTITWTSLTGVNPVTVDATERAIDLIPGDYRLVVTDNSLVDLGCVTTMDYTLAQDRQDLDITGLSTDQTICSPNGSVQITSMLASIGGVPQADPGWTVSLLDANSVPVPPGATITGVAGVDDTFAGLGEATYFLQVQNDLTKCYSERLQFVIDDVSENPTINSGISSPQYSLNPNPASWTGEMKGNVFEPSTGLPDPAGYTYSWYSGLDTSSPAISAIDSITGLDIGNYTIVARNNVSGCESTNSMYLPFVYLEPIFNTLLTPQTLCAPVNGAIEVTDIALDGNPDLLSDYTFNWHHDVYNTGDAPEAIILGNDARTAYDDIDSRSYYIIAQENWWMIESNVVKVDVIDSTTNPIIIFDETNYQPFTSCDASVIADGELAINVYEDNTNPYLTPPFNYGYSWYTGTDVIPANIMAGETTNTIAGFTDGKYTVVVVNLGNNCQSEKTYTIEDESIIPNVVLTQTPNTNCLIEFSNGSAIANVNNSPNSYDYEWYEGTSTNGNPIYQGEVWNDRPVGLYTVVATDQLAGTCFSVPVTIQVEDALVYPTVLINEITPVTNCDPERPNGVLSAVTEDGIEGHTFEWYLGNELYDEGPVGSKFGLLDYELVVTNDVTMCETVMQAFTTEMFAVVPDPNVQIISELTSCVEANGTAMASVAGEVTNHIFRYYDEDGVELTNLYDNYSIQNLEENSYLVIAEDRNSGCLSDTTEFSIANEVYFPEIDIISSPSSCLEPTGSAKVIISDETRDYKVTWYGDNGFQQQVNEIVFIPSGNYRVEVEGTEGCFSSDEVEVTKDLLIYNGVSPNGDGLNDFFKIVCLEQFPDNNVKIYNRAGLLVYEQTFYDGNDPSRRFEGISNEGLSVIGSVLPIGTYFYVIDKNDGSKAKVGYLELNR